MDDARRGDDEEPDPFPARRQRHDEPNGNGWPELSEEPLSTPELSEMPTPAELARAYGQSHIAHQRLWPRVVQALNYLYQGVLEAIAKATHAKRSADKAHGAVEEVVITMRTLSRQVRAIASKLEVAHDEEPTEPRRRLPSLSEYDAENTPHGGIKISPEAWQLVQERIRHLDDEALASKRKAELAAAQKVGADQALSTLASQRDKLIGMIQLIVGVGGPILAGLAWLATHFLHL